jgi:hypothetical protein
MCAVAGVLVSLRVYSSLSLSLSLSLCLSLSLRQRQEQRPDLPRVLDGLRASLGLIYSAHGAVPALGRLVCVCVWRAQFAPHLPASPFGQSPPSLEL